MVRVQLVIPDDDRDSYVRQARLEGVSLSAWLRAAARERLERRQKVKRFESPEEVEEFFRSCAALEGPARGSRTGASTCASWASHGDEELPEGDLRQDLLTRHWRQCPALRRSGRGGETRLNTG